MIKSQCSFCQAFRRVDRMNQHVERCMKRLKVCTQMVRGEICGTVTRGCTGKGSPANHVKFHDNTKIVPIKEPVGIATTRAALDDLPVT